MQQSGICVSAGRAWAAGAAALLIALGLGACSPRTNTHGNLVDPQLLEQVKPGALNKDQVQTLLGTPSSISTFDQNTWYYIGKQTQRIAFLDPDVLDQKVVAIEFDSKGTVKAIHQYGEADGKEVDMVARTTPTGGKSYGMFDQILGSPDREVRRQQRGRCDRARSLPEALGALPQASRMLRQRSRRRGWLRCCALGGPAAARPQWAARIASSRMATMLMILIIGLTAGPAVSL